MDILADPERLVRFVAQARWQDPARWRLTRSLVTDVLPLVLDRGHIYATVDGAEWLVDTGAPVSLSARSSFRLCAHDRAVAASYLGLDASTLSGFVGRPVSGLLGMDVMATLDVAFDIADGTLTLSENPLPVADAVVALGDVMGVPVVQATIGGRSSAVFFDTGAQVTYLRDARALGAVPAGELRDFYPGLGEFVTETWHVDATVGAVTIQTRCGVLPDLLELTLQLAGVDGILGSDILASHRVVMAMRRRLLSIA